MGKNLLTRFKYYLLSKKRFIRVEITFECTNKAGQGAEKITLMKESLKKISSDVKTTIHQKKSSEVIEIHFLISHKDYKKKRTIIESIVEQFKKTTKIGKVNLLFLYLVDDLDHDEIHVLSQYDKEFFSVLNNYTPKDNVGYRV